MKLVIRVAALAIALAGLVSAPYSSASTLSGSVKSDKYGLTFYGTASCLLQGNDVVCWEFLASDCSQLPELMANPIQFEGQPKAALIPETFAQTCE